MSLVGRCVLKMIFGSSALKLISLPGLWPPIIAQPSLVFGNPAILALHACEETTPGEGKPKGTRPRLP